jgi:hypothetical protein
MKTNIPNELIEAYRNTRFIVFSPAITITIGETSKVLEELLLKKGVTEWAFITSVNPYSKQLTDKENDKLFDDLKEDVKNYPNFMGEGVGADSRWKPEISLLVLGISRIESERIGRKYGQNAIVLGSVGNEAELILLQ